MPEPQAAGVAVTRRARRAPTPAAAAPVAYPLSPDQQSLWLIERVMANVPVFNVPVARRLRGRLDRAALRAALDALVRRHAALRTTFADQGGEPVQIVAPAGGATLDEADLTGIPGDRDALAARFAEEQARRLFDLRRGPLFRAALATLAPDEHVLVLTTHHIVSDAWSMTVLCADLGALYREAVTGVPATLPPPDAGFGHHAARLRDAAGGEAARRDLAYWAERLAGAPAGLALPTDRPRPMVPTFRGATLTRTLPAPFATRLEAAAGALGATPFMVLLAALAELLGRLADTDDVIVGAPVAGRSDAQLERVVGFFVNTVALRVSTAGDPSYAELIARAKEATVGALPHAGTPFWQVVQALREHGAAAGGSPVQVQLVLRNVPDTRLDLSDMDEAVLVPDLGVAVFDLTLMVKAFAGGDLLLTLNYSTDLYDADTAHWLLDKLVTSVRAAVADPHQHPGARGLLSGIERWRIVHGVNATDRPLPDVTTALELIARDDPTAPAILAADAELSYGQLQARASRLAHRLRAAGVGPDAVVALCLERTADLPVALLAVWRAGGAYLPLDPGWPAERLRFMLDDSGAAVLVTDSRLRERHGLTVGGTVLCLDEPGAFDGPSTPPPGAPGLTGANLAYLMYTSGSTGRPKGVAVPHAAVVNLLIAFAELLDLAPADRLAAVTTLSFDISVLELLAPLVAGAQVLLVEAGVATDGVALRRLLIDRNATVLQATPATWRLLLEAGGVPDSVQVRLCGGEALPRDLADALLAGDPEALLWNVYGPTETTVWSAAGLVEPAPAPVLIGPPIANTQLHVLDRNLEPVPVGVIGEVHIGGIGLARGYHRRPGLTGDRFRPDPFSTVPGARLYASGDLARRRADGSLELLGRLDGQIKLRGFRIELGEIEAVLRADDLVADAVVQPWGEGADDVRLVAYLVPAAELGADGVAVLTRCWPEIRARAQAELTPPMVPAACVALPALPRTPNGKTDRRALPAPVWGPVAEPESPAGSALEQALAAVWRDVLGASEVGLHDDFFAIGGHSLLATRVLTRVRESMGLDVPFKAFFEAPTIAGLAEVLTGLRAEGGAASTNT